MTRWLLCTTVLLLIAQNPAAGFRFRRFRFHRSPSPSPSPTEPVSSPAEPVESDPEALSVDEEDVTEDADPPLPEGPTPCRPEEGWWRPSHTYNDPSELITASAVECCDICRAEVRCITWSRDRRTGACALKDAESEAVLDDRYDSGFIDGTAAATVAPLSSCFAETGVAYPEGDRIERRGSQSAEACCERCRNDIDCFSWHRNDRNRMCVLNRNVPPSASRGDHVSGATTV